MPQIPEALHRWSRDPERRGARGRDSCVSRESRASPSRLPGPWRSGAPSQAEIALGVAFWTVLTLVDVGAARQAAARAHSRQCRSLRSSAAMALGGPAVGGWVAAIGTTEMRELRGRIPWYGTLANHAGADPPGRRRRDRLRGHRCRWSRRRRSESALSTSLRRWSPPRCFFVLNTAHRERRPRTPDRPVDHGSHRRRLRGTPLQQHCLGARSAG